MKDSGRNLEETAQVINRTKHGFVLAGEADLFLASLVLGAAGGTLTPSNFAPKLTLEIYNAFQRGDLEGARRLNEELLGLLNLVRRERKYIAAVKAAMREVGIPTGMPRPPLTDVSETLKRDIRVYLVGLGLR
jgi:4-hydroxy-tetrahydrodipicolinate synthase